MSESAGNTGDRVKTVGAIVVTVVVLGILAWWLIVVASKLDVPPVVVGKSVRVDTFQRSKDILLVVLPLATTGVGFWLGNQNTQRIESQARRDRRDFRDDLSTARNEASRAKLKQAASELKLRAVSRVVDPVAPANVVTRSGATRSPEDQLELVRGILDAVDG